MGWSSDPVRSYPVQFPARVGRFFGACGEGGFFDFCTCWTLGHVGGYFLDGLGSLFGRAGVFFSLFLGCLGMCLEWFGDVFGWVWDGVGNKKNGRTCPITTKPRVRFSSPRLLEKFFKNGWTRNVAALGKLFLTTPRTSNCSCNRAIVQPRGEQILPREV